MSSKYNFLDIQNYTILYSIGSGSFSNVYLVQNKKTQKTYAAKVSLFTVDQKTQKNIETLLLFREVNLMTLLRMIVKLISLFTANRILKPSKYSKICRLFANRFRRLQKSHHYHGVCK